VPDRIVNFGRNVAFVPLSLSAPRTEQEVLDRLNDARRNGQPVRAVGRLHSWSDVIDADGAVVLDMRRFRSITFSRGEDDGVYADIEAGCTITEILDILRRHGGYTLPTYGMLGAQTIVGAIGTATHGTGRASLSHYVTGLRLAAFAPDTIDPRGNPVRGEARIFDCHEGERLKAARCNLGCLGVVLSVRMRVLRDYCVEERTAWFDRLEDVLAQDFPRQQFYLVPWSWRWFAQLRRPLDPDSPARPGPKAVFLRGVRLIAIDILFNGTAKLASNWAFLRKRLPRLYRHVFPLIARANIEVTDRARHLLMMRHDLYRHVEMELFVPEQHVSGAAAFVEWVLRRCGGDATTPVPVALKHVDFGCDPEVETQRLVGGYMHDQPVTFRRVLRDDTLISMTSGEDTDAWYGLSLITYRRNLTRFREMTEVVARCLSAAYGARPHWGKINPLNSKALAAHYPHLGAFFAQRNAMDPGRVFINDYTRPLLEACSPKKPTSTSA
jgi:hypothetical protein